MEEALGCGIDEPTDSPERTLNDRIVEMIRQHKTPLTLLEITVLYLQALLAQHPSNISAAARTSGKSRWALTRLLKKLDYLLERPSV